VRHKGCGEFVLFRTGHQEIEPRAGKQFPSGRGFEQLTSWAHSSSTRGLPKNKKAARLLCSGAHRQAAFALLLIVGCSDSRWRQGLPFGSCRKDQAQLPENKKAARRIKNVLIVKGKNQVKLFIFLVVSSLGTHFLAQRFFSYTSILFIHIKEDRPALSICGTSAVTPIIATSLSG